MFVIVLNHKVQTRCFRTDEAPVSLIASNHISFLKKAILLYLLKIRWNIVNLSPVMLNAEKLFDTLVASMLFIIGEINLKTKKQLTFS